MFLESLLAIMLGRLEMDVRSCITAYLNLAQEVFQRRNINIFARAAAAWRLEEKFDSKILEECIKRVVKQATGDKDAPLKRENDPRCRV